MATDGKRVQPAAAATTSTGGTALDLGGKRRGGSQSAPPIRSSATQRLLDTLLDRPAGALAVDAPESWKRASTTIQRHTRGHLARKQEVKRGGTMWKTHFAYMYLRQPTPLEYALLAALVFAHQALFVLFFTEPGFGDEAYRAARPLSGAAVALGFSGLACFVALNLFDAHLWRRPFVPLKYALLGLSALLLLAGAMLVVGVYPQAPLAVYFLAVPTLYYALRQSVLNMVAMHHFFKGIAIPSVIGGTITLVGWMAWVFAGNEWDGELRRWYYERMACEPDAPSCLPAAILYFAPMGTGMLNIAMGGTCYLLYLGAKPKRRRTLHVMVRLLGGAMLLVVAAAYVQAAVSGANSQLANTVLLFSLGGLVLTAVLVGNTIGWEMLQQRFLNIPLIRKIAESLLSDWAKAAMLFGGWLPFTVFMISSAVKQQVRICFWLPRGETDWEDERTGMRVVRSHLLTHSANGALEYVRGWRWGSVLSKTMWLGIFFMVMNVGFGKMTNVFISWLIQTLLEANTTVGVVCAVFIVTGVVLFMIPPVPGFAVYLCGSFLLPQFLPFWQGVVVSALISFGLKLLALVIQQKLIGEMMGNAIAVRSFIGVNSLTMRSIRKILEQPGLGLPKVCILVGGPDWPTSVTTGILRLPVLQMVLGTSPVLIVVTAVTMAGAFQLRKNEGGMWASVSDMMLGVASGVMFGSLVASAYFIEDTSEKHRAELEALPRDEEVDAEDRKKEAATRLQNEVTAWRNKRHPVPLWLKLNLAMGATLQIITCYLAQFFSLRCFRPFEMTDRISDQLDGSWTNLFLPLGRIVLILWAVGVVNMVVFRAWAQTRVRAALARRARNESPVKASEAGSPLPSQRAHANVSSSVA